MAEVKLTKNELRAQQQKLAQLQKYLPTLQLKKALLQIEVNMARQEIHRMEEDFKREHARFEEYGALLSERTSIDPQKVTQVLELKRRFENIAGVEVPYFDSIKFVPYDYSLFDTPSWVDSVIVGLRQLIEANLKVQIAREKKQALEKELREVSIRVNLFEKILIPRARKNIKKIKVFLGDLLLAAVSQAKVAKNKLEERKKALRKTLKKVAM
jgi:V/A-type H+-transporting ATPase subunit D